MLRLILVALFLIIFFLLGIVSWIILFPMGLISKKARDYASYYIVRFAFKSILFLSGTKVTVIGAENISREQAALYVGNHRSFFDIVLLYSLIPARMGFISKKEIKKVFPLNVWMYLMNCIFLDRSSIEAAIKMINDGVENIKNGISIFIFPEGTRSKTDDGMVDFKEGSLKMAKKAKCPIVPVAINNTSTIFEDNFPKIKKSKICIEFGKPIDIESLSKEDKKALGVYTHDIVWNMVQKNKEFIKN